MIARALRWGLVLAGLGSWGAFLAVALRRLFYPLEIGNLDGVAFDHAVRIAHGRPIYVQPSLEFIPFAYMPLYPTLVAPLVRLFGPHLWEGRLVSILAAIAVAAILGVVAWRETRSGALAVAASGLFLMGEGYLHGVYDVINNNTVFLCFVFAGLATLRFTRGNRGAIVAALLLTAAFFTKQHAILFGFAAAAHLLLTDRRRLVPFLLGLALGCGGGFLILSLWLGPWFRFYVWEVPSHWSDVNRVRILDYFRLHALGAFSCLTVPAVVALAIRPRPLREPVGLWWWTGLAAIGTGLMATLDPYEYLHVLMPTLAAFSLLGPLALERCSRPAAARTTVAPGDALATACVLLLLQFMVLTYSPFQRYWPRVEGAAALAAWEDELRHTPGPVAIPYHGYYGTLAGKGTSMHLLPLDDVLRAKGNSLLKRDPQYFEHLFATLRSGPNRPTLFMDAPLESCGNLSRPLWASLATGYRLSGRVGPVSEFLRAPDGYRGSPTLIYEPVEPESAAASGSPASAAATSGSRGTTLRRPRP